MKAVRVKYTVKSEYIEQNKANIKAVMDALRANPIEGMHYSTHQLDDSNTFIHINMAKDAETMAKLNDIEAFKNFRMGLKASDPVSPPESQNLHLVDSNWDL